jgi:hypothetical protein
MKPSQVMEQWAISIRDALKSKLQTSTDKNVVVFEPKGASLADLKRFMANSDFVRETLELFQSEYLLGSAGMDGSFYDEFMERANNHKEYGMQFAASRGGDASSRTVASNSERLMDAAQTGMLRPAPRVKTTSMKDRHMRVWEVFKKPIPVRSDGNGNYIGGVGDLNALMRLPLKSRGSTQSPVNSLFLATEFGTGIQKNVGPFVRGPNKTDARTKEKDGSWWFGEKRGEGMHMFGQKGFHFLYSQNSRKPHTGYIKFFRQEFPRFFIARVAKALANTK